MLSNLNPAHGSPPDPEEILVGVCRTCRKVVEAPRAATRRPGGLGAWTSERGAWNEAPAVECPHCAALSLTHTGPAVYLYPKEPP